MLDKVMLIALIGVSILALLNYLWLKEAQLKIREMAEASERMHDANESLKDSITAMHENYQAVMCKLMDREKQIEDITREIDKQKTEINEAVRGNSAYSITIPSELWSKVFSNNKNKNNNSSNTSTTN